MSEWKETRLKGTLSEPLVYGLNVSSEYDDRDLPRYIRITDFDDYNNLSDDTFKSLPIESAEPAMLKEGDLLFARSGATVGKTFLYHTLPYGACYAGYLIRARLNKKTVIPEFVSYYTKSIVYSNWKNKTYIQATIQNLSAEKYNQLPICIPSLEEQSRIVSYLDSKTAAIDKQVSLLSEKRDAYLRLKKSIINCTVTKGLNPDVKMKDSGVEWIGEIPEHWKIAEIKSYCKEIFAGATPSTKQQEYWDGDIPWIPSGSCHDSLIISYDKTITKLGYDNSSTKLIKPNTALLAMTGATCANTGYLTFSSCANQSVCAYVENEKICNSKFLFYLLQSARGYILTFQTGGAQAGINVQECSSFKIPFIPLPEQQSISNYLDDKCLKIDTIVSNIDTQIEKYKLLKRALINEVVTGKRAV